MRKQTRFFKATLTCCLLALLCLTTSSSVPFINAKAAAPPPQQAKQNSLYQRLGGYDAIAAVVDDFVGRLIQDPQFSRFFAGLSVDSKKRVRQHIVDQFCAAAGGPCLYTGRDMKTSHTGLGITEADWNAAAKHLVATLDKFKVPQKEKDELLGFVSGLKKDIVEK